ncbi:DUF4097 family beta strand repeat-containing protein, partial [Streptomyces lasiicapitis]|uniref:hypothetical protein n=1 Tax=Streptomyces lasiicapitis TaxID=1923961 RepID=UPI00368E9DA9
MPTFDTAKPVYASVILEVGSLRITASDRADTVVDVRPTTESRQADVRAAEQTRVEYASGRLLVKGPKDRSLFGKGSSIDVEIALPEGSHLQVTTSMADFTTAGRLGECEVKTSAGDLRVEWAGSVRLHTGYGQVLVDRVEGPADVTTASGAMCGIGAQAANAASVEGNGDSVVARASAEAPVRAAGADEICAVLGIGSGAAGLTKA